MTQPTKAPFMRDLSLLAIDAAEELERLRNNLPVQQKAVKDLSNILQESFSQKANEPIESLRLDHASILSRAIMNSIYGSSYGNAKAKTISELAKEAINIATLLNSEKINSKDQELERLISFCVALSDSAALYREELEELKKGP